MSGVDMVTFQGLTTGGTKGVLKDRKGTGFGKPAADGTQSFSNVSTLIEDLGTYTFDSDRSLNTGDSGDFEFVCGN